MKTEKPKSVEETTQPPPAEVWIARLSKVLIEVDAMHPDERRAAFSFMRDKYSREWPSNSY